MNDLEAKLLQKLAAEGNAYIMVSGQPVKVTEVKMGFDLMGNGRRQNIGWLGSGHGSYIRLNNYSIDRFHVIMPLALMIEEGGDELVEEPFVG